MVDLLERGDHAGVDLARNLGEEIVHDRLKRPVALKKRTRKANSAPTPVAESAKARAPLDHPSEIVMEMHQVRYFLAVAEELNFTRASERCNVTQPSLSRAIKLLEEELGGQLFRREREFTHLTDLGHMVRPHLQSVYDHSKLAKRVSQEFARKWPLKLGIMSTISPDEIVDLIANIRTRHPEVELRLCDANAKELRARLLAGELEVAIYALPGEEPDGRIHSIPLFREQMVLAVHRDHRLAETGAYPVQEMNGESRYPSHELRVRRLRGPDSRAEGSDLQSHLLERARRLDLGHGRRRVGIRIHAYEYGQTPWCDWPAGRRARILLAASKVSERVRGRRYSPGVGSLVREAMRKTWFGKQPGRAMDSEGALETADIGEAAA